MFFNNLAKLNTDYVICQTCYSENTNYVPCKNCYSENTNLCNCNNNSYKSGKINNSYKSDKINNSYKSDKINNLSGGSGLCLSCNGKINNLSDEFSGSCLSCNGKINNLLGGSRLCPSCNSNSNGNDIKYQRIRFDDNIKKEEEILLKYGYSLNDTHENRINALNKAITKNPKLKILRHINALRTLQKSNKKIYNKLNKDIEWIQRLNQETNN